MSEKIKLFIEKLPSSLPEPPIILHIQPEDSFGSCLWRRRRRRGLDWVLLLVVDEEEEEEKAGK